MSLRKRLRVIVAAVTQDWREYRCSCGTVGYTSEKLAFEPTLCASCEARQFDRWAEQFQARTKGAV